MKRNLYLKTTPTAESVKRYMQALHEAGSLTPKTERVNVYDSLGRVTASPVFAKCCSPLFNAAAMDGIAVIAAQTANASERNPLQLRRDVDYRLVDTGDPIKAPYDAVIMAEQPFPTRSHISTNSSHKRNASLRTGLRQIENSLQRLIFLMRTMFLFGWI